MLYILGRFVFYILAKVFLGYKSYNRSNVPSKGPLIVASNHASYLDPIFAGIGLYRPLDFMARETLFRNFFFGNLIRMVHSFPVKRNFQDVGAMREAVSRLKKGRALLIFPESTRTKDGRFQNAKAGISLLAHLGGAPVVPVYIKGSFEVLPKGARFLKIAPVSIFFGKVLDFKEFLKASGYDKPADAYKPFADLIMEKIASLRVLSEQSFCHPSLRSG
jgi:1-acyl-sn-glycerol-3-phosphate acyltransferase